MRRLCGCSCRGAEPAGSDDGSLPGGGSLPDSVAPVTSPAATDLVRETSQKARSRSRDTAQSTGSCHRGGDDTLNPVR